MVISTSTGFGGGMQSYLGTLLTVKGHKRGGETEFSYATFLTDPSEQLVECRGEGAIARKQIKDLRAAWRARWQCEVKDGA
eukprot:768028-Hanusia_phi.AAC.3